MITFVMHGAYIMIKWVSPEDYYGWEIEFGYRMIRYFYGENRYDFIVASFSG